MVQEGTTRTTATGAAAKQPAAVEVMDSTGRLGEARAWLALHSERAAAALGVTGEIRVRVVGDLAMAEAHQRWRGQPGTTDVLTFDYTDPAARAPGPAAGASPVGPLDADILVCLDEAARHAAQHAHSVERELLLYVVHGILHCIGHDDHDPASAESMHRREDEILTQVGVGPTYRPEDDPGRTPR